MKVKLLRRVFCVVMCIVILACSSVNAFGAPLFGGVDEYYWDSYDPYSTVEMYWIDVNISNSFYGGINRGNLVGGINAWVIGTRECTPHIVMTEYNGANVPWPDDGWIAHSIPGRLFWEGLFVFSEDSYNTLGKTVLYSGANEVVQGYPGRENITHGYVYYNYNHNNMTGYNWTNTVAHEIGHTLGFGHYSGVPTIMNPGNTDYVTLQAYDINEFVQKYRSSH